MEIINVIKNEMILKLTKEASTNLVVLNLSNTEYTYESKKRQRIQDKT